MLGFQPYETFQLLIETGGIDRTNTLLIAACDAYARRGRATQQETEQFFALAARLFPSAAMAPIVAWRVSTFAFDPPGLVGRTRGAKALLVSGCGPAWRRAGACGRAWDG